MAQQCHQSTCRRHLHGASALTWSTSFSTLRTFISMRLVQIVLKILWKVLGKTFLLLVEYLMNSYREWVTDVTSVKPEVISGLLQNGLTSPFPFPWISHTFGKCRNQKFEVRWSGNKLHCQQPTGNFCLTSTGLKPFSIRVREQYTILHENPASL